MPYTMTSKEKFENWYENGRDFNAGITLLREIGKSPNMVKIMAGREHRYASKLEYELRKASGSDKQKEASGDEPQEPPAGERSNTLISVIPIPVPATPKEENSVYPAEIEKIKSEYSRLYNLRAQQHGLMTEVTPDNSTINVKRRKIFSDSIAEISQRLELLYLAKEAYFETGTMPDMDSLFGEAKKADQQPDELPDDVIKLKAMKKALQINIHKAKNKLEFQTETKQKRSNPMPDGPKRLDLVKTIEDREKEIERIEYKLVELAH